MKRKYYIYFIAFILILSVGSCNKFHFGKYSGNGRLLKFISEEPVKTEVKLFADDPTSAKNIPLVEVANAESNENGYFSFKFTSRSAPEQLRIEDPKYKKAIKVYFQENVEKDIETIYIGSYTFKCKVNLTSVSNSEINFYNQVGSGSNFYFVQGTNTQFLHQLTYTVDEYNSSDRKYIISYYTLKNSVKTYSSVSLPINASDTLSVSISY